MFSTFFSWYRCTALSRFLSDVGCRIYGSRMLDVGSQCSDVGFRTSDLNKSDVKCQMSYVGSQVSDVGLKQVRWHLQASMFCPYTHP